jgi:hypothetical protein
MFKPIGKTACEPDGYKPITKEDAIQLLLGNINKSLNYYYLNEEAREEIRKKKATRRTNPFPVLIRQGTETIVLKYANEIIEGFHLNGAMPQECLEWVRDVWLKEEANQEQCWKVHQKMTANLRKHKSKDV